MRIMRLFPFTVVLSILCVATVRAQPPAPSEEKLLKGLQYRLVGPFRGGRVLAVAGVPGEPNTYYFGGASGGVWKTIDGGASWKPMFDKEDTASIGAI